MKADRTELAPRRRNVRENEAFMVRGLNGENEIDRAGGGPVL